MDVIMPKKNGKQASKEMRRTKPDAKVLLTSGCSMDVFESEEIHVNNYDITSKPVKPHELASKIREMLDVNTAT